MSSAAMPPEQVIRLPSSSNSERGQRHVGKILLECWRVFPVDRASPPGQQPGASRRCTGHPKYRPIATPLPGKPPPQPREGLSLAVGGGISSRADDHEIRPPLVVPKGRSGTTAAPLDAMAGLSRGAALYQR